MSYYLPLYASHSFNDNTKLAITFFVMSGTVSASDFTYIFFCSFFVLLEMGEREREKKVRCYCRCLKGFRGMCGSLDIHVM